MVFIMNVNITYLNKQESTYSNENLYIKWYNNERLHTNCSVMDNKGMASIMMNIA